MSVRVGIGGGESYLEHQQVQARLEALGLKLKPDNTIDESSASAVAGGMGAIQALAKDGVLGSDAVAKLRRQTNLVGAMLGKDLPISKKEDNAWRALALDLQGTATTLQSITKTIETTGTIDNSLFHRAGARLEKLMEGVEKLNALQPDTAKLARTSPEVLRETAEAAKSLTGAATRFESALSMFRSAMLEKLREANGPEYKVTPNGDGYDVQKRPGLWSRLQIDALAGSLASALEAMPTYAKLGRVLSTPIGSPGVFGSAQAAELVRSKPGRMNGAAQTIVNALGTEPGIFPGSVGPQTADRFPAEVRSAYSSVLRAAANEMVSRKEVSNSYGNAYTGQTASLAETERAVPRPVYRAALSKAQNALDQALASLPASDRNAGAIHDKVLDLLGNDQQAYATAAGALYLASLKTGQVRAGYGVSST